MSNTTTHDVMVAQTEKAGELLDFFQEDRNGREQFRTDVRNDFAAERARIDQTLADWESTFNSRIPIAPNLISNALMDDLDGTRPVGFGSSGVTTGAAHPPTKAFEGPSVPEAPAGATSDPEQATATAPYWFGNYNMGPRIGRGGLSGGWGGLGRGNILKITAQPGDGNRLVTFTAARQTQNQVIGFRGYVKLVKGSSLSFGTDAGHAGVHRGKRISKADIDAGPQGWLYVDFTVGVSRTMHSTAGTNLGFSKDEEIEAYLALPYMYVPHHPTHGFSE